MNFFDADGLAGKDGAEVKFFVPQTGASAIGDDNNFVVKRIIDIGQSLVGACRGLIDRGRALHVQSFVRTFVIEDFDKVIEPGQICSSLVMKNSVPDPLSTGRKEGRGDFQSAL